jgi:hypothetical protein
MFLYSDQTHKKVKDNYGKASDEFEAIKKIFHGVYDRYFGYAFCYRLRNHLTHARLDSLRASWQQAAKPSPLVYLSRRVV